MKRFGKRILALTAAAVMGVTSLTGCGSKDIDYTEAVAVVNDEEIALGVANFYARVQQAQYETYYASFMGDNMWEIEVEEGVTYESSFKTSILESLEDLYIIEDHMGDYNVELTAEDQEKIAKAVDNFMESNSLEAKEVITAKEEYVTRILELSTIQSKMYEPMRAGVNEEVSDEEAAQKAMIYAFFTYSDLDENGVATDKSDEEKAEVKEAAEDFARAMKEQAATSVKFEASALEAEADVQTITFDAEGTTPAAEVVLVVDAMSAEGEISDVIETEDGCYVAMLTSLLDREATDAKKAEIIETRKSEQYSALLAEWRAVATIEEFEDVWEAVSFADQGVILKQEEDEEYATE